MIAFYRLIPTQINSISKSIRTFVTSRKLLAVFKHDLKFHDEIIGKYWEPKGKEGGTEYRMLDNDKGVRVLLVSRTPDAPPGKPPIYNPELSCTIRVGVGACDDGGNLGLAHLLEHVIARSNARANKYKAITYPDFTVYTIYDTYDTFWCILRSFSEKLFSENDLDGNNIEKDIESQRKTVHEEFVQKMPYDSMNQILIDKGIIMPKFHWGNFDTLKAGTLLQELDKLRKLYRKRPVFACIDSNYNLDAVQRQLLNNFWIFSHHLKEEKREHRQIDLKERNPHNIDLKNLLFVLKSDADFRQFNILFLFDQYLNNDIKELNSLEYIALFLKSSSGSGLSHYLLEKKMATKCTSDVDKWTGLRVSIDLTQFGLENLQKVKHAVFQYIKLLRDKVDYLNSLKYVIVQKNMKTKIAEAEQSEYVLFIAEHFLRTDDEMFDEKDLVSLMDVTHEKHLLSSQLIDNKNVVYSILMGEPQNVPKEFFSKTKEMETENINKTEYYCYESTELFKENDSPQLSLELFGWTCNEVIHVNEPDHIIEFGNAAHQVPYVFLYESNLELHIRDWLGQYNTFFGRDYVFAIQPSGNIQIQSKKKELDKDFKEHVKHTDYSNMSDKDFEMVKDYTKKKLAKHMTNSLDLAQSLLADATHAIILGSYPTPIPMVYNELLDIDHDDFKNNINAKLHSGNFRETHGIDFKKKVSIKSINANEITVTMLYYKVPHHLKDVIKFLKKEMHQLREELRIYTIDCNEHPSFNSVVLQTVTLEEIQPAVLMGEVLEQAMKRAISKLNNEVLRLYNVRPQLLFSELENRSLLIQVIGHKEKTPGNQTFDEIFKEWFMDHLDEFYIIKDPLFDH